MRVIIIGAGEVGTNIAAGLAPSHDVVVIDIDADRVDELNYSIDALAIEGDGTSLETLEEAGIDKADMLIASTDDDEVNIIACSTAKAIGDAFTIARVRKVNLLRTWQRSDEAFGVDFMVCTDLLTAEAAVNIIGLPTARDVDSFANGAVQMAELKIPDGSPVDGQTVQEADRFDSLTFVGIFHNGDVEIATGQMRMHAGDNVVVVGSPESVQRFAGALAPGEIPGEAEEVVIIGGSDIGYHSARLLEDRGFKPRLIEEDADRARDLAERLPRTVVMKSDATDVEFLTREHVDEADAVIAALTHDEMNLLVSLLARQVGAKRTVAIVESGEYVRLFERVGVDVGVNPREVATEEIIRFTRGTPTENVAFLENDRAEVLEIEVGAGSVLVDKPIRSAMEALPDRVVIGAITRNGSLITPRGDTVIEPGDHIIVFAETEIIGQVTKAL